MQASAAKKVSSLDLLKANVMNAGLCVACGACVGLCPHLVLYRGRVVAPDRCDLEDGRCYRICPVASDGPDTVKAIGDVLEAWQARAVHRPAGAQYGGVVSCLAALALEKGPVDGAVLTEADDSGAPHGFLAKGAEQVERAAGSVYAAGGGLEVLNRTLAQGQHDRLLTVALPCQAKALAAMKTDRDYPAAQKRLGPVIGLFCTWNLSSLSLAGLLAGEGLEDGIKRMDIPPPPAEVFEVSAGNETKQIPLGRVRELTMPGCALCPDMTAEAADLSVGAVEGRPGWNTVLVRNGEGKKLFDLAVDKGLIEAEPAASEPLEHLKQAAAAKRSRALPFRIR